MAKTKLYALWKSPKGDRVINAFQADYLKNHFLLETSPKEKASLFDLETNLAVRPVRKGNRQPYFSYYPGEASPLKGQAGSFEYSSDLIVFVEVFSTIKKFQLKDWAEEHSIYIFPKLIKKLERVYFSDGSYVVVKIYMELFDTYPYSAYYRLNGHLVLEFYVQEKPTPRKRVELAEAGIPLFEAEAQAPDYTSSPFPYDFTSENQIAYWAGKIREVYENRNYKLYGEFSKYHTAHFTFLEDNERKYTILKTFEDKVAELKEECHSTKEDLDRLSNNLHQKKQELSQLIEEFNQYEAKMTYFKAVEAENTTIKKENSQLKANLQRAQKQLSSLRDTLQKLRQRSFWDRLFNKDV